MDFSTAAKLACHRGFFIAIGLVGLSLLVTIHELGHFLFCKLFNIATPSFSIGFGPRIFSKKIGETEFAISLIPMGGYVEIAGSAEFGQGEQQLAHTTDERSFISKPYYQKLLVMCGGIFSNLIFAYLVLTFIFFTGTENPPMFYQYQATWSVFKTQEENIQPGDRIIQAASENTENNGDRLLSIIQEHPDTKIPIVLDRNGQKIDAQLTVSSQKIDDKTIGILPQETVLKLAPIAPQSLLAALKSSILLTGKLIKVTFDFFLALIRLPFKFFKHVLGPIGLIRAMAAVGACQGAIAFLSLLAFISINLAIINLVPLPVFDGGQIVTYSLEAAMGRPLPLRAREAIHIASWVFLLALIVYVSFNDIKDIIFSLKFS